MAYNVPTNSSKRKKKNLNLYLNTNRGIYINYVNLSFKQEIISFRASSSYLKFEMIPFKYK